MAAHHGLEWAVAESTLAEDPGSHDENTFYVTNMREPVSQNEDIIILMRGAWLMLHYFCPSFTGSRFQDPSVTSNVRYQNAERLKPDISRNTFLLTYCLLVFPPPLVTLLHM